MTPQQRPTSYRIVSRWRTAKITVFSLALFPPAGFRVRSAADKTPVIFERLGKIVQMNSSHDSGVVAVRAGGLAIVLVTTSRLNSRGGLRSWNQDRRPVDRAESLPETIPKDASKSTMDGCSFLCSCDHELCGKNRFSLPCSSPRSLAFPEVFLSSITS